MYLLKNIFGLDMLFYTFDDFMRRREYIKEHFLEKDDEFRILYDLYIESRPWMKEYYRLCIWDYLNDYLSEEELLNEYDRYLEKYGDRYD